MNRFSMLVLMGIYRTLGDRRAEPGTAVLLSSRFGSRREADAVLAHVFNKHLYPPPLDFIHTMTNTATFYAARELGVSSPNIALVHRYLPFESVLMLVPDVLNVNRPDALAGHVEDFRPVVPSSLSKPAVRPSSTWLQLSYSAEGARGRIRTYILPDGSGSLVSWLSRFRGRAGVAVKYGELVAGRDVREAAALGGLEDPSVAASSCTDCADALCRFLLEEEARECIWISRDTRGLHAAVHVRRLQGGGVI